MIRRFGRRAIGTIGWGIAAWPAVATAYLLAILASALGRRGPAAATAAGPVPRFVILVPAHDEERVVGATVESLMAEAYPTERRTVLVLADNCSDATAAVAREHGATVWERDDPEHPGKGQALAWALGRLPEAFPDHEGVVFVDADCLVVPGTLAALGRELRDGASVAQADYRISNPEASPSAALRYVGFALFNTVRPLGKTALGLSSGLLGTGMAFSREALEQVPWRSFSVGEDREMHVRLVQNGVRVRFVADACVTSPAPTTQTAGETQQQRWETGNVELARASAGPLLRAGLSRGDRQLAHAGFELLVPPFSLLAAGAGAGALAGIAAGSRPLRRLAGATIAGQAIYVAGGLRAVGAPPAAYRAFAAAPWLIVRRLGQYLSLSRGGGASAWETTAREG